MSPEAPETCIEDSCDRAPSAGDARCGLHASRLGPVPRTPQLPRVTDPGAVLDVPAADIPAPSDPRYLWRAGLSCGGAVLQGLSTAALLFFPAIVPLPGDLSTLGVLVGSVIATVSGWAALAVARTPRQKTLARSTLIIGLSPWVFLALLLGLAFLGSSR